eukprot:5913185-Pyramimonas_sp.AAC.1
MQIADIPAPSRHFKLRVDVESSFEAAYVITFGRPEKAVHFVIRAEVKVEFQYSSGVAMYDIC